MYVRDRVQLSFTFLSFTLVKENGGHLMGLFALNGPYVHTHTHAQTP